MPASARADNQASPISSRQPGKGDHVFLVDGSSYIFRAYHALPPLNRKSDGLQVNAVLGFCNMLWKLMRDMKPDEQPTHLAVVFDKSGGPSAPSFIPSTSRIGPIRPTICARNSRSSATRCAPSTCLAWSRWGSRPTT